MSQVLRQRDVESIRYVFLLNLFCHKHTHTYAPEQELFPRPQAQELSILMPTISSPPLKSLPRRACAHTHAHCQQEDGIVCAIIDALEERKCVQCVRACITHVLNYLTPLPVNRKPTSLRARLREQHCRSCVPVCHGLKLFTVHSRIVFLSFRLLLLQSESASVCFLHVPVICFIAFSCTYVRAGG